MTAGYSGTPLWRKLGLKPGLAAAAVNPPPDYWSDLLAGAPEVRWGEIKPGLSFIHLFTDARAALESDLPNLRGHIVADGMIWVSWPKKASRRPTDITEDTIRAVGLPLGLVDVKVCAVDAVWSGLKLVIRKEARP